MPRPPRSLLLPAMLLAAACAVPSVAAANDVPATLAVMPAYDRSFDDNHRIVVAANLGTLDRSTSGTMPAFGYDGGFATLAGADLRVFGPMGVCSSCLTHGFAAGYTYSAGPTFGWLHEAAFRMHIVDVAYAARVEFPCMRRDHRRVHLTGLLGASGMYADAGLGDVTPDTTDRANERVVASSRYDHAAAGWRVGLALDFTFDAALVGLGVDLRELYGVGTEQARTFLAAATLRVGFDVAWPHGGGTRGRTPVRFE